MWPALCPCCHEFYLLLGILHRYHITFDFINPGSGTDMAAPDLPVSVALTLLLTLLITGGQSLAPTDALAFWTFQEATGAARVSQGLHAYELRDGNISAPIPRGTGGVFGPYSALFAAHSANNSARLYAPRADVPAITAAIAGRNATVSLFAWVRPAAAATGLVAGVWNEHEGARQYAIFTNLGACDNAPEYHKGLGAHISNCGTATPNHTYCVTRACDPRTLPQGDWHCLATVYNGSHIQAYVNGSLVDNGGDNPFHYPGGIFSPEARGTRGADFDVGCNTVTPGGGTAGWPVWANTWLGQLGGLAVFAKGLPQTEIMSVCGAAEGFGSLRNAGK